ncbi:MAG: hypothetical protein DRG78_06585 [Epsilonproteobacteria bacterium]|nr:MAG: hypothetical protein DRG78_06585 [Campylobacterota bacterium]
MIHIENKEKVVFIENTIIRDGLEKEFERLPLDFEYPLFGYFIVIEDIKELEQSIILKYGNTNNTIRPDNDNIEMIEKFNGYSQIVCIQSADFGVSLFVSDRIATYEQLVKLFEI